MYRALGKRGGEGGGGGGGGEKMERRKGRGGREGGREGEKKGGRERYMYMWNKVRKKSDVIKQGSIHEEWLGNILENHEKPAATRD